MASNKLFAFFFLLSIFNLSAQETKKKTTELNEVIVTKTKKAVEQKADRTIFDFVDQPSLNSGSVMEGIKKLPGLLVSDIAGMLYQGKQLEVYMDKRPLNISSNELNSFLESMPANSIEKIEIITQPGAEFPATSGGAIMNIITNKNAKKYLSATYSNSSSITNYGKLRWRTNNSLLLNAKNKYFGWQFNVGQNYRENVIWSDNTKNENNATTLLNKIYSDKINRGNFAKSAINFDLGNDRLLLNYDVNYNNNGYNSDSEGLGFVSKEASKSTTLRQESVATYQKRFNDKDKKLDFKFTFDKNANDFLLNSVTFNTPILDNVSVQKTYNFNIDYTQPIKLFDNGKITFGSLYEQLFFDTKSKGITNLNYQRRTAATYFELQTTIKKFDFIVGARTEDYNITGNTNTAVLNSFKEFRFFPNTSIQYNLTKQINLNANYNKKINLPSTSALNPNNNTYQNQNSTTIGNPNLQPTIYDNFEIKFTAFNYANIGYSQSNVKNFVATRITLDNNLIVNTNINVPELQTKNFNISFPIPYMLFTKGVEETLKMNVNPDEMNFLFVYAGYNLHKIPEIDAKPFWMFSLMSQIVLPKKIKFVANYFHITPNGNYYYFVATKPFNSGLDLNLSKKFLNDQLTVSLYADDVLNSNIMEFNSYNTPLLLSSKTDFRKYGFSLSYKIPTKNRLAKEDPNLLNKDKKDDKGMMGN
jgi:hypothetical protein